MVRTTRRITLTHEGSAFLEDCQRLLTDLSNAEASVSAGGVKASGHVRITAPAGFRPPPCGPAGAPLSRAAPGGHPQPEPVGPGGWTWPAKATTARCGWGDLPDSSLVSVRLADNRRLCVGGAGANVQRHGRPATPADLVRFDCLTLSSDASQTRGWAFSVPSGAGGERELVHLRPRWPAGTAATVRSCTNGAWAVRASPGAAPGRWEADIRAGRLVSLLDDFAAPPNGIYALFPQRRHLALAGAAVDRLPQARIRAGGVLGGALSGPPPPHTSEASSQAAVPHIISATAPSSRRQMRREFRRRPSQKAAQPRIRNHTTRAGGSTEAETAAGFAVGQRGGADQHGGVQPGMGVEPGGRPGPTAPPGAGWWAPVPPVLPLQAGPWQGSPVGGIAGTPASRTP